MALTKREQDALIDLYTECRHLIMRNGECWPSMCIDCANRFCDFKEVGKLVHEYEREGMG